MSLFFWRAACPTLVSLTHSYGIKREKWMVARRNIVRSLAPPLLVRDHLFPWLGPTLFTINQRLVGHFYARNVVNLIRVCPLFEDRLALDPSNHDHPKSALLEIELRFAMWHDGSGFQLVYPGSSILIEISWNKLKLIRCYRKVGRTRSSLCAVVRENHFLKFFVKNVHSQRTSCATPQTPFPFIDRCPYFFPDRA